MPIYALTGFFVCIDFFQTCELFRKKEDIHLKPLTPGEALNHIPYIHKSVAGSGTQSQVSRRLFCFFFLRLKKEDNGQPRTSVPTIRKQAFIFSLTSKGVAGSGTQPQVSRCLFASFSALEKEVTTHSRKCPNDFFASFFFA